MLDKIEENQNLSGINLVVVGSGYVGLPLAVLRTLQGANVFVVDIDESKIDSLSEGKAPFYEEGLDELLEKAIETGRISFHTNLAEVISGADVIYSCVGTPQDKNGSANLVALKDIGEKIGSNLKNGQKILVIQTSTVPPGTTREFFDDINTNIPDNIKKVEIVVADRPEFLQQGRAFRDNLEYARKVVGIFPDVKWARELIRELEDTNPDANFVFLPNLETAELVKYASNAFLATKISFANEIAEWADIVGADVKAVMEAVGMDKRISPSFFGAGIGWAGGCFPKDVKAAEFDMKERGGLPLMNTANIERNKRMVDLFVNKIVDHFEGSIEGKVVAAAGVSFKPGTDFVYPSQSVDIIEKLLDKGAKVKVYDPVGLENFKRLDVSKHKNLEIVTNVEDMFKDVDAYALLTEWKHFLDFDLAKIKDLMNGDVIFDGRNALEPEAVRKAGFIYKGVGRRAL